MLIRCEDGKQQQVICGPSDLAPITAASITDPYIVIRRADGGVSLFTGDSVARQISETAINEEDVGLRLGRCKKTAPLTFKQTTPPCQAIEVFSDISGIYRTFAAAPSSTSPITPDMAQKGQRHSSRHTRSNHTILEDGPYRTTDQAAARRETGNQCRSAKYGARNERCQGLAMVGNAHRVGCTTGKHGFA